MHLSFRCSLPALCIFALLWSSASLATGTRPTSSLDTAKVVSPERIEGSQKVNAEALIGLIDTAPELVLIDSRIESDRQKGFIEGSISLPNTETDCDSLAGFVEAKDTPVLFYCNGVKCGRSAKATRTAIGCGYSRIYWFRGGIEEWKEKEYPLVY